MTKTLQAPVEFGVKQNMSNSAHHQGPHSLSTHYVNTRAWNAGATAKHGDQSCSSAHYIVSPLKYYLAVSSYFKQVSITHEI